MTGEEQQFLALSKRILHGTPTIPGDYQFWWPRRKLTIRRKGRRIPSLAPMFPGYLFLEADAITPALFHSIKRITGFVRFLKSNEEIHPLSSDDLALIRHFLSFGEIVKESRVTFDENNRIVVKEGPLKGLEGKIVKVDRRKGRAKVKLDMYENAFLIDLGFEILDPGTSKTEEATA